MAITVSASQPAFAADNETAVVSTANSFVYDQGAILEFALIFGGVATLGFVIAELYGIYLHKSAQTAITSSTALGINSIVSMTTLAVAAGQGIAVTEIAGVPTQIVAPEKPPTTPTKP
jgi:nitrous oxidase accessory protein NosD